MKIRRARLKDKTPVFKLMRYLYRADPKGVKNWEKKWKRWVNETFVAEIDNKIVAYISIRHQKQAIYITDLYVLPGYRRKGIATRLIKLVKKNKSKFKAKFLRVDVRKKDYPARRLYEKIGFKFWKQKGKSSLKLIKNF